MCWRRRSRASSSRRRSGALSEHLKQFLAPRYAEFIGKEFQTAYLESYSEYGQNIFDRYVIYADYWIQDQEYRDPDTGEMLDRAALNEELEKIEKPAGICNPKDFRNEIVNFVLRARANNQGRNPVWTSYEKLRVVIEKKMFSNTEDLLPVISFNAKASVEDQKKHDHFVIAWSTRATREAGAPALGVVSAGAQGELTGPIDDAWKGAPPHAAPHRPAPVGEEAQRGQPPALHPALQGPDQARARRADRPAQHHRHAERREREHPGARHRRADVPPGRGRAARAGIPGQPGVRERRPHRQAPGRRRRSGPGASARATRARARTSSSSRSRATSSST